MDADKLFDAIGEIDSGFIISAHARRRARRGARLLRFAAAAVLVFAALGIFLSTSTGRAFAENMRNVCEELIEKLFPPKTGTTLLEGQDSDLDMNAHGEIAPEGSVLPWADYVIYVEEDGNTIVKSENYFRLSRDSGGLPEMYMEIVQVPDISADELAAQIIAQEAEAGKLTHTGTSLPSSERAFQTLNFMELPESGRSWDDCIRRYDICENGKGGCFKITTQYFLEASEGFGSRCAYYLSTFEILPEQG